MHTAARHDDRRLGGADPLHRTRQQSAVGKSSGDGPNALFKQRRGIVECFGLHVLRHGECYGAGLRRRSQHAHGFEQRERELIGTIDAVPIARHGLEDVVHGHILRLFGLQLLKHRTHVAPREDVAGQQQDGNAIDGGAGGAGDHIGRAGTNRRRANERLKPVLHLGERRRRVSHRLLVAAKVIRQSRVLTQRLPDAGDVAVTEDAPCAREERRLFAVALDVLILQECDGGLRRGEPDGFHRDGVARTTGTRGSFSCQAERTQAYCGSSEAAIDRALPASAFR
jgi:hypothetical protein